jgi:hypothetical protein
LRQVYHLDPDGLALDVVHLEHLDAGLDEVHQDRRDHRASAGVGVD